MIKRRTAWEVTVKDGDCPCGCCHVAYRDLFLDKPDRATLAEAIRHEANRERASADTLTATPDAPGSWIGGAPSNGELAAGCLRYAEKLDALAEIVEAHEASIKYTNFEIIVVERTHD